METTGSYGEAISFAYPSVVWEQLHINGSSTSKGGKSVASKDDVVKALYRLNPGLKDRFENEDEFVEALIAAGTAAFQTVSAAKLGQIKLSQ